MSLEQEIYKKILFMVENSRTRTEYRKPLVGFARADDPLFLKLKEHISENYLLPCDLLENARTVISFFIPFSKTIVSSNRVGTTPSQEWLIAYIETNELLGKISEELISHLKNKGIEAVTVKPTHNFDPNTLLSRWSHKHAAYVAGLGTFGIHHMLITKAGCAGRFGSVIISEEIAPSKRPSFEYCLAKRGYNCSYCIDNCPTSALSIQGLDKPKCHAHLKQISRKFSALGKCDACGKCALGPCALAVP